MDLLEFLKDKKCPVTKTFIAEKLYEGKKTPTTTFHNKLYNIQGRKFNSQEIDKIIEILNELGISLQSFQKPNKS